MPGLTGVVPRRLPCAHRFSSLATYTLGALNRKTGETLTLGSQCLTLKNTYTVTGKKASQTGPDGSQVTYQWDNAQRLTKTGLAGVKKQIIHAPYRLCSKKGIARSIMNACFVISQRKARS